MDEISAFLTTTFVTHSYEVESSQAIVSIWDKFRKNLKLKDNLDYISSLLATGRIMDYRIENKDLEVLNTIINDIHTNIATRKIQSEDLQKELVYSLITSASISRSEKVENIRDIVDLWVQIKEGIVINDDVDLIAAILTTGRIMELKIKAGGIEFINDIFLNIKKELGPQTIKMTITQKEIAAAFLTSAYIEISKKVEKIRDIIETWQQMCKNVSVDEQWDYVTMILSMGKIRDMDAAHIQGHEGLINITGNIRTQITKVTQD
jgi:type I restriction-modification system DNA methylase subunit